MLYCFNHLGFFICHEDQILHANDSNNLFLYIMIDEIFVAFTRTLSYIGILKSLILLNPCFVDFFVNYIIKISYYIM